jgi:hypothetical protein
MLYTKQSAAGNSQKKRNVKKKHSEYASSVQFFRLQWHSYSLPLNTHILRKIQTKPQSTEAEITLHWFLLRQILATSKTKQAKGVHINYKHVYIRVYIHKHVRACGGAYARQLSAFWEKHDKSAIWAWFIPMAIACCTDSDQNWSVLTRNYWNCLPLHVKTPRATFLRGLGSTF